jgi:flavin-dependent dehydrogenase
VSQSVEIAIVGAGPAGARAAELLAGQGADVLLLDAKAPWEKPCGGGLTPPLFDEFAELAEVRAFARPVAAAAVAVGDSPPIDFTLDGDIWMVSREKLGHWQLDRALRAGARHRPVKVKRITRNGAGWLLETGDQTVRAATLVGADGAASGVRSVAAPGFTVELVPTRVAYPSGSGPTPDVLLLRFYRDLVGYLWDFPRPDHRSVGIEASKGAWSRRELDGRIDDCRAATSSSPPRAGAVIGTAHLGHGDFSAIAGEGFALLGDAAGFADPFTGEGIRNAIRSADLFARAWRMGHDWRNTYPRLARRAFAVEFAVSRVLRKSLSESRLGVRLLHRAGSSRIAYALVATMLNTLNVHDFGPGSLLAHWRRGLRDARPARSLSPRAQEQQ